MRHRVVAIARRTIRWVGGIEPAMLSLFILIALTVWAFVAITGEVLEGDTQAIDEWMLLYLRQSDSLAEPIGPVWMHEMGRDFTALGGIAWLILATIGIAGFLALHGKPHMAMFLIASTVSGLILSLVLKNIFDRPRPSLVPHLSHVYTSSFPSGHSMLSAVVYLTLGTLVASVVERPLLKIYVLAMASLLTIMVGVSRVYLGVHYPTDVVAGWIAGLFWALTCSAIAHRMQRVGKLEDDTPENDTPLETRR